VKALPGSKTAALSTGQSTLPENGGQAALEEQRVQAQSVFESVTEHLRREPAQSTRLLQSWIHTE
jgi:flagellar M-ring protein FliF